MQKLLKGKFPALLLLVTSLSVQAPSAAAQGGMWGDGWGWGHMFFGSFMMLLFWGGLIILLVFAVRSMGTGAPRGGDGPVYSVILLRSILLYATTIRVMRLPQITGVYSLLQRQRRMRNPCADPATNGCCELSIAFERSV